MRLLRPHAWAQRRRFLLAVEEPVAVGQMEAAALDWAEFEIRSIRARFAEAQPELAAGQAAVNSRAWRWDYLEAAMVA